MHGIIVLSMIVIYVLTLCTWFICGRNRRLQKIALIVNFCLAVAYISIAAIIGTPECNSEWFCFTWVDHAFFLFLLHLFLFWCFMILQLLVELITKYLNPDKNKQQ